MAGIYIHIPFCKSRCIYCGFYSTTGLGMRQRYVDAVCREMELRPIPHPSSKEVDQPTIYIGGGTPSQLSASQLHQLFDALSSHLPSPTPHFSEVTIEANPDDVTEDFALTLTELPVNRVSMGAQTFDDHRLRFLNRRHTADQVPQAVQRLRDAGIRNISIDLMYGFPGETLDDWKRDIDAALALGVEHISAYCLMYEQGTRLYDELSSGRINEIDEELERQMYETLMDRLAAADYEHYEISNFALKKASPMGGGLEGASSMGGGLEGATPSVGGSWRGLHNSSYWTDVPYTGLGAAAHSYDGQRRQWNVSDLNKYIIGIESGHPAIEWEDLDADSRYNDRVMLSLRTSDGLDLSALSEQDRQYLLPLAKTFLDDGLLVLSGDRLRLSRAGLFVSNMVMSELMRV